MSIPAELHFLAQLEKTGLRTADAQTAAHLVDSFLHEMKGLDAELHGRITGLIEKAEGLLAKHPDLAKEEGRVSRWLEALEPEFGQPARSRGYKTAISHPEHAGPATTFTANSSDLPARPHEGAYVSTWRGTSVSPTHEAHRATSTWTQSMQPDATSTGQFHSR